LLLLAPGNVGPGKEKIGRGEAADSIFMLKFEQKMQATSL
jgi:hypothetical protein